MTDFRLNINIDNVGRVMERVLRVERGMDGVRRETTRAMAERTGRQIVANLEAPKAGIIWDETRLPPYFRLYDRPSGVSGGFPASQRGDLVRSLGVHATPDGNATLEVGGGLPRPYAFFLEFGFRTWRQRMMVRFPFVRPSVEQVTSEYRGIAMSILGRTIGR